MNEEHEIGRLYYAINPHVSEAHKHAAYLLILSMCDKVGGYRMRSQAPKRRALGTTPPPSLAGRADRLIKAWRILNDFGQRKYLFASKFRQNVMNQISVWDDAAASRSLRMEDKPLKRHRMRVD